MVLCVADEGGGKGMNNREKSIGSLALKSAPRRIIIPAADQDHAPPPGSGIRPRQLGLQ